MEGTSGDHISHPKEVVTAPKGPSELDDVVLIGTHTEGSSGSQSREKDRSTKHRGAKNRV